VPVLRRAEPQAVGEDDLRLGQVRQQLACRPFSRRVPSSEGTGRPGGDDPGDARWRLLEGLQRVLAFDVLRVAVLAHPRSLSNRSPPTPVRRNGHATLDRCRPCAGSCFTDGCPTPCWPRAPSSPPRSPITSSAPAGTPTACGSRRPP